MTIDAPDGKSIPILDPVASHPDKYRRKMVTRAIDSFRATGVNVVGIVANSRSSVLSLLPPDSGGRGNFKQRADSTDDLW